MTYEQVVAPGVPGSQGPALISGGPAYSGQPSPQFEALQSGASSLVGDIGEVAGYIIGVPELTVLNAFGANLTNSSTLGKVGGLTIYAPTPHVAREAGTLGLEAGALAVSVVVLPEIGIGTVASLAGVGAANVAATAVLSPQGIGVISPQQALVAFGEGEAFAGAVSVAAAGLGAVGIGVNATGAGLTRTAATVLYAGVSGGFGYVLSGGSVQAAEEGAVVGGIFGAVSPEISRVTGALSGLASRASGAFDNFPVSDPTAQVRAPLVGKDYLPTSLATEAASPTPEAFTAEEQASLMPSTNELEVLPNQAVSFKLGSTDSEINIGQGGGRLGVTSDVPEEETQPGLGAGTVKLTNTFQYSDLLAEEDYPNYIHTNIAYTSNDLDRLAAAGELKPIGYNGVTNRPPSSPVYGPPAPPEDVTFFRLSGTGPASSGSGVRTVLEDQRNAYLANPYEAGLAAPQGVSFIQTRGPGRGGVSEYSYYLATPASVTSPLVNFMATQKTRAVSIQSTGIQSRTVLINSVLQHDPIVNAEVATSTSIVSSVIGTRTVLFGTEQPRSATYLSIVSGLSEESSLGLGLVSLTSLGLGSLTLTQQFQVQQQQTQTQQSQQQQEEGLLAFPFVSFIPATTSAERGGGVPENYLPYPPMQQKKRRMKLRRGKFVDVTIRNQVSENVLEGFGEYAEDLLGSSSGYLDSLLGRGRGRRRSKKAKASPKRRGRGRR